MRNTYLRKAGGALPAAVSPSRRSILSGIVAAPAMALPASAAQAPATQTDISDRVRALAGEMSNLLAMLDDRGWRVEVRPARSGIWQYEFERLDLDANVRLQRAMTTAAGALNELQPGSWRVSCNVPMGVALIANDDWRSVAMPADRQDHWA